MVAGCAGEDVLLALSMSSLRLWFIDGVYNYIDKFTKRHISHCLCDFDFPAKHQLQTTEQKNTRLIR